MLALEIPKKVIKLVEIIEDNADTIIRPKGQDYPNIQVREGDSGYSLYVNQSESDWQAISPHSVNGARPNESPTHPATRWSIDGINSQLPMLWSEILE